MKLADEEERKFLKAENDRIYQKEMEAQHGNPDDIFSLQSFKDAFSSWEVPKSSIFYSKDNFWDFFTIFLTLVCGIYTLGLFV